GWFYVLSTTFFLVTAFILMLSRFGKIRLGPDDSRPEFGTVAWFAMLFTTGMGIGLVFWGVAEPVTHLHNPRSAELLPAEPDKPPLAEAASEALAGSFFTGASTRGRSTSPSACPWVTSPSARGFPCVPLPRCIRCSATVPSAGRATWWTSSRCSARSSGWRHL